MAKLACVFRKIRLDFVLFFSNFAYIKSYELDLYLKLKIMKKQTLFLLVCLLSISINNAQTFNDGVLEYTVISGTNVSVKKHSTCPTGTITIPNTVVDNSITYTITSIRHDAFSHCSGLTSITIPNSVTSIGYNAFAYCSGLTSFTIPNSVTSVGDDLFSNCIGLTNVTISNAITSITHTMFAQCTSLTSVIIPNSVTSIDDAAFANCSNLASVTIPNSVTNIGSASFVACSSLTSVTIPNSVTDIRATAFSGCSSLTNLIISNAVTRLEYGTFRDCSSLTNVTIPNAVTSIELLAFADCSSLANVTIPNSVTNIGSNVFQNCTGLTNVTVNWGTPLVVPTNIFDGVDVSNIPLTVPAGTETLYQVATVWQDFGSFVVLPVEEFVENNINVQLYPNPVNNQLNIEIDTNLSLEKVLIYNYLGQLILQSMTFTIDVSDLKGDYFVQIFTDKGNVTKKIIIN